jgi:hypothetical protein
VTESPIDIAYAVIAALIRDTVPLPTPIVFATFLIPSPAARRARMAASTVTEYLTESGLRAIVRNPRAVRNWPLQQMPGFAPEAVSDSDLDALIAYLHQAEHPTPGSAARVP